MTTTTTQTTDPQASRLDLSNLKTEINRLATEGRRLRSEAQTVTSMDRWRLQQEAQWPGSDARDCLMAYGLLRGKTPEQIESPHTRTKPDTAAILAIIRLYAPEREDECKALLTRWERDIYARSISQTRWAA